MKWMKKQTEDQDELVKVTHFGTCVAPSLFKPFKHLAQLISGHCLESIVNGVLVIGVELQHTHGLRSLTLLLHLTFSDGCAKGRGGLDINLRLQLFLSDQLMQCRGAVGPLCHKYGDEPEEGDRQSPKQRGQFQGLNQQLEQTW